MDICPKAEIKDIIPVLKSGDLENTQHRVIEVIEVSSRIHIVKVKLICVQLLAKKRKYVDEKHE